MIEIVFLGATGALAFTAAFFWIHPKFDDCLWGRIGLLGTLSACGIILVSVVSGYHYHGILPEVAALLGSQAIYMSWLVFRFARKRWRIRQGVEKDHYPMREAL